jgi:tripartite-type tricarboxylate transporter receptor subunit TctC
MFSIAPAHIDGLRATGNRCMFRKLSSLSCAVLMAVLSTCAQAAAPRLAGPLRLIVPYAPGGGAIDLTARALQHLLEQELGVPVFVENRPGGGTKIGTLAAMNAAPDGRTLVVVSGPGWIGFFYTGIFDFKPWETMTALGQVAESPYSVVTVKAGGGVNDWPAVVARAKAARRPIRAGAPASGGFTELAFNEMVRRSGVEGVFVPFAGAGPARTALLGGDIDVQMDSGQAFQSIRGGLTRAVAISTPERFPLAPDVPTYQELGIGESLPTNTYSVWGPPRMDPQVAGLIARALEAATKQPAFIDVMEVQNSITVGYRPGADVVRELRGVDEHWGPRLSTMKQGR